MIDMFKCNLQYSVDLDRVIYKLTIYYMKAKDMERRMQEQKERAMALAQFQQRNVKDEPTSVDAFPAASIAQRSSEQVSSANTTASSAGE